MLIDKNFSRWLFLAALFMVTGKALPTTTYKLTQVSSVTAGEKYVFKEGNRVLTTVSSLAVQLTVAFNTTGLSGSESYIWTLETATGGYYMKMSDGKYLNNTNSTEMSAGNKNSVWSIVFTDNAALITNNTFEGRFLGYSGYNTYKAYIIGDLSYHPHDFTVYHLEEETESTPTNYTITYHIGDNDYAVERTAGATLSLDNPAAIGGMDFAGWSSSNDVTAPVWVSNTTEVAADMELYAIFSVVVSNTPAYKLVEEALTDWRGDYLIAYNTTTFADGRVGGTDGLGKNDVCVSPGDNLAGKVVKASWGDTYNITLMAVNDNNLSSGYVLKTKDGKFNYCTESAAGLTATTNKNTANNHPIQVTFNSPYNISLQVHNYLFQYNSTNFRFRTGSSPVYLYKRSGGIYTYSLGKSKQVTITTAKYGTYCSDEGLNFSETGIKVYIAKVVGNEVQLTEIEDGIIPANTGVMTYKDVTTDEVISVPVQKTSATITDNEMVGLTEKTAVPWTSDGKYNYILQKDEGKAKFFKATGSQLIANRAYLHTSFAVTGEAHALEIVISDGETTGITQTENTKEQQCEKCFNLLGQQIERTTKGLQIVNGRKKMVK